MTYLIYKLPALLFGPSAAQASSSGQVSVLKYTQAQYKSQTGARLNPLNPTEAIRINTKLRELGFFKGKSLDVWSAASRNALQSFKAARGLATTDTWDSATELALLQSNG